MNWHAAPEVLDRYANEPELLDDTTASSVEQHLVACEVCRAAVASAAAPEQLEASWLAVADVIDQPRPSVLERVLSRVGVAGDTARLVGATGALQLAWLGTVVVLTLAAVKAATAEGSDAPFLVLAPLLPLGAVALAFLPAADPGGESAVATPLHGAGLVVRRLMATVLPTVVVLVVLAPALPADARAGAAWLLPAMALASVSLLLGTFVRMSIAVGAVAISWLVLLVLLRFATGDVPADELAAFDGAGQLTAAAVALIAIVVLFARRDRFATLEVDW